MTAPGSTPDRGAPPDPATGRLVVVGASLAGLRAVESARKAGFAGSITLVGAEEHLPYDRPPLSKAHLGAGSGSEPAAPYLREEAHLREELGVELLLGRPATALDTAARVVHVGGREVAYDAVVLATGSTARRLPGTDHLDGVHPLRTLDDAREVRRALEARARTVVVGAGFIGSEVASAARGRGLDVTVVEAQPTPLARAVGAELGAHVAAIHERHGTRLLTGVGVASVEGDGAGRVERVVLDDGTVRPADLVVVGIGVVPATGWLEGSGLRLDDGVVCDETLWAGAPGVWAAGDVVRWPNATMGETQRLENWTGAADQGAAAARNALDPAAAAAYATVPFFWSDWYDVRIQMIGSPVADEVLVVDGDPTAAGRWVALYRRGDRLIGALAVDAPAEIMKYRAQVMRGGSWDDALAHAAARRERAAGRAAGPAS